MRLLQVAKHLLDRGHEVVINTAAPLEFFTSQLPHRQLRLRKVLLDSGAFQQDAFTVDMQSERQVLSHADAAIHDCTTHARSAP